MKLQINESQTKEFKQIWKDEYLKQICGFANVNGGTLYIGIDDDGNAFFKAGYIESWGRGIEKIIEESQKFNGITPQFKWENGLWVEFYFNNTPNKIENTETRVKTREKILELIMVNPNITNQELADELELTVKGIEWQVKKLKEDGKLERIGGAKGGHWEILK